MLLGTLLIVAPSAGADDVTGVLNPGGEDNPSCSDLDASYVFEAKDNVERFAPYHGENVTSNVIDGKKLVVDYDLNEDATVDFVVDQETVVDAATSDVLVSAVIIKKGDSNTKGFDGGALVYEFDPAVASHDGLATVGGQDSFSHITFCAMAPSAPPPTGSLSVDKAVAGNDTPAASTQFSFTVDCSINSEAIDLNGAETTGTQASFTLTASQTPETFSGLPVGAICTVVETNAQGADSTTYKIGSADPVSGTTASGATIAENTTTTVLFTNTFNEGPGSLSVDKAVAGNDTPAASTQFSFTVDCSINSEAIDLNGEETGTQASFTLTASQTPETFSGLPVGAICTVVETNAQGADSTTYKIGSADPVSGTTASGATIAENTTTTVLFTNTFNTSTPPPVVIGDSFGVDIEKVNDADEDGAFGNFESADTAGDAVEFQVSILNTGTGALTVTSLSDSFDGTTVDLLANPTLSCLRSGATVALAAGLPGGSTTVCTFTLEDYAPAAGDFLINTATVVTVEAGDASDDSTVVTDEITVLPEEVLPSSITIVKAVAGPLPDDPWQFGFTGDLGEFTLTSTDSAVTEGSLSEGEYTITETLAEAAPLTGIDCGEADVVSSLETGSVAIDLAEGEDVVCTFTNTFPEAEVLPEVVVRPTVLPRTGSSTQNLAGVGLALIGFGAVLLAGSRRRNPLIG